MTLEADAGDRLVVARTLQMEVVARGPVRDLELVGGGLELLHLLAIELQRDREAGSDGAVDRLRSRGGGAGTDQHQPEHHGECGGETGEITDSCRLRRLDTHDATDGPENRSARRNDMRTSSRIGGAGIWPALALIPLLMAAPAAGQSIRPSARLQAASADATQPSSGPARWR